MSSTRLSRAPRRLLSLVGVSGLALALAAWAAPGQAHEGGAPRVATASSATALPPVAGPTAAQITAQLTAAIKAKKYPSAGLFPTPGKGMAPMVMPASQCLGPDDIFNTDDCNFGPANATKTAVVLGDSVAASILPGVIKALVPLGYHIHGLALPGCPVADVEVQLSFDPAAAKECNDDHLLLYAQVQRLHPDLLILTDSANDIQRLKSGNRKEAAVQEWIKGERTALNLLRAPGRRTVILAPNPSATDPKLCVTATSTPADCLYTVDPWWYGKRRAESQVAAEVGDTYVDTLGWYAVGGKVPMFAGRTTMRWDMSHITYSYSQKLARVLRDAILGGTAS